MAVYNVVDWGNKKDTPIIESDYYKWLVANNPSHVGYRSKRKYLASKGFQIGVDKITGDCVSILGIIDNYYLKNKKQDNEII